MPFLAFTLQGKVQGVGFRYHTRLQAQSLGLTGFVTNLPNGSVYIEASGSADALNAFTTWCHQGPPLSHVKSLTTTPLTDFSPLYKPQLHPNSFIILKPNS